ncbi:MAG: hypothetical protein AAF702_21325 [Chloroflexota bacterium]
MNQYGMGFQMLMSTLFTASIAVGICAIASGRRLMAIQDLCLALTVVVLLPLTLFGAIYEQEMLLITVLLGGLLAFGTYLWISTEDGAD